MRRRLNDKEWVHEFVSAIMGASASGPTHEDELDAVRSLLSAFLGELPDHSRSLSRKMSLFHAASSLSSS